MGSLSKWYLRTVWFWLEISVVRHWFLLLTDPWINIIRKHFPWSILQIRQWLQSSSSLAASFKVFKMVFDVFFYRSTTIERAFFEIKMKTKCAKETIWKTVGILSLKSDHISFRVNDALIQKRDTNYGY